MKPRQVWVGLRDHSCGRLYYGRGRGLVSEALWWRVVDDDRWIQHSPELDTVKSEVEHEA